MKALAKNRRNRYQTAESMMEDLLNYSKETKITLFPEDKKGARKIVLISGHCS